MRKLILIFLAFYIQTAIPVTAVSEQHPTGKNKFTTIITETEKLNIPVESNRHIYLILKFTNLSDTPSVFYTSSSLKGKPIDDTRQGPLSFRTVSLPKKDSVSTKTFLCKEKDQLTIFVKKGLIRLDAVKAE